MESNVCVCGGGGVNFKMLRLQMAFKFFQTSPEFTCIDVVFDLSQVK